MLKSRFRDCIDTLQVINHAARKDLGEDSYFCAISDESAVICVLDGCGGLGARKYDSMQGHTGAYIAARSVSGAVCDWYKDNCDLKWGDRRKNLSSLNQYIMDAYKVVSQYAVERLKISGSMVRKLPTTIAFAYIEKNKEDIIAHIVWAGDSRVYLLDANGLSQLTKDDVENRDALDNLTSDAPMFNVLSADGDFKLNYREFYISKPSIIFAATDGCFGYIPSPMEFEGVILQTLLNSDTPRQFKDKLSEQLVECAGDDIALGMVSFYFGTFSDTKRHLKKRLESLEELYLSKISDEIESSRKNVWNKYKVNYERYL